MTAGDRHRAIDAAVVASVTVAARSRTIVTDLGPEAVDEMWVGALFGRPVRELLRDRLVRLDALRDDVGRSSARRAASERGAA